MINIDKKGKLSPWYIRTFEVLEDVSSVVYKLALFLGLLGVQLVLYVSIPKGYNRDVYYITKVYSVLLDMNLSYEEEMVAILDQYLQKLM